MHTTLIKTLGQNIIGLVFPVVCVICRVEGRYLCKKCSLQLRRNEFQICPVCGSPAAFGKTHSGCMQLEGLDGLISATAYKDPLARKLVEYLKYKFITGVAEELAKLIIAELRNLELVNYLKSFTLVPLPLHPSRERWRGFNQAELIAKHLSLELNLKLNTGFLVRKNKTKVQAELSDEERLNNVANAFQALELCKSQKILIIDDVSTTRSTLSEATKALKQQGAKEVWGLVFAQG